jgi:nicotinamide-nucleotide amidase
MSYESGKPAITALAGEAVALARAAGLSFITAESCTAGALATLLADTPGAGDVLQGGFVTYAKSCKEAILGIDPKLLEEKTAVSGEVALAMAAGALERCPGADIAIATTCVGGPTEDEDGNPVGLTFVAIKDRNGRIASSRAVLGGESSGRVRGEVLQEALGLLLDFLRARR